jgi:Cys-tRNA(Pro)/Cys-tRNA(Cys) deacylase
MASKKKAAGNGAIKNNVTRLLDGKKIDYRTYAYAYSPETHSAIAVAEAIGKPPAQVFKSLVALADKPGHKPMLAVIPGPTSLNLKALAKVAGVKKVKMASHQQAEKLTGLQTGGISPLALINKGFTVYLDEQARKYDVIVLSAGQRGAQVELAVEDLVRLTRARFAPLGE